MTAESTPGAAVDVRTPGNTRRPHPGAVNVPLQQIGAIASEVPDKARRVRVLHERGAQPGRRSAASSRWATPMRATSAASAAGAGRGALGSNPLLRMRYRSVKTAARVTAWSARGVGRLTAPTGGSRRFSEASKLAETSPGGCVSAKWAQARKDALCAPTRNLSSILRTIRSPGRVRRPPPAFADADAFAAMVDDLAAHFVDRGITKVVGAEARGFIVGAAVALRLGAGFVPCRKPGKLPRTVLRESYALEYGTDVLEIHADALTLR